MISNLPIPVYDNKTIIGIDDWAFRKGVSYGSIVVDAESGHPIDLIESRDEMEVTSWLKKHQEIKIVTRDRATSYSKAITTALPACKQIADRFHIVKNLSERIYETISKQYPMIKKEFIDTLRQEPGNSIEEAKNQTTTESCIKRISCNDKKTDILDTETQTQKEPGRKERLYNRIHDLHNKGVSSRKIAATLHVNKETVLIHLRHDTCPTERTVYKNNYESYMDIIMEECGKGRNMKEIFKKIVQKGFKGKLTAFYSWFGKNHPAYKQDTGQSELCKEMTEKQKLEILFDTLSPRKISIYVSNPEFGVNKTGLPCKDYSLIQQIIQSSPLLQKLREIMISFKDLLKSKMPELLDKWMVSTLLYKIPDINSFLKGIKSDIDAVKNAIAYPWSNGFVEGNVNRLKTKKREMYGRAGFQLLRRKVVLSKMG
jgi:transposase